MFGRRQCSCRHANASLPGKHTDMKLGWYERAVERSSWPSSTLHDTDGPTNQQLPCFLHLNAAKWHDKLHPLHPLYLCSQGYACSRQQVTTALVSGLAGLWSKARSRPLRANGREASKTRLGLEPTAVSKRFGNLRRPL